MSFLPTTLQEAGAALLGFREYFKPGGLVPPQHRSHRMGTYLDQLPIVAERHVKRLTEAHKHYGDSCLKRGGVGLFMMLARKWDRIERRVATTQGEQLCQFPVTITQYDILEHVREDTRPEGLADDVADLIDYLMIVEAELRARGQWPGETAQHTRPDQEHPFGHQED